MSFSLSFAVAACSNFGLDISEASRYRLKSFVGYQSGPLNGYREACPSLAGMLCTLASDPLYGSCTPCVAVLRCSVGALEGRDGCLQRLLCFMRLATASRVPDWHVKSDIIALAAAYASPWQRVRPLHALTRAQQVQRYHVRASSGHFPVFLMYGLSPPSALCVFVVSVGANNGSTTCVDSQSVLLFLSSWGSQASITLPNHASHKVRRALSCW